MNSNPTSPPIFTYKDLLLRKLYYSIVSSVLSQLVILQIYVFISNFNLLHPLEWTLSTVTVFTSLSTWLYLIPFTVIIFAQSIICAKDYVFKQSYCSTRFQNFISMFSVHNLVLFVLNTVVGSTLVWLFLCLGSGNYQNLVIACKDQKLCLNEGTFFLIVNGVWTGMYYFVKVYVSEKHLSFPVIHQRKLLQLKADLIHLLKDSFMLSIRPMFYFIILYMVWGHMINDYFRQIFNLFANENTISLSIYFYLWIFGTLYYFNMNLMCFFFNLFLTEPVEFPLYKITRDSLTLQESINMSHFPIVQNLACLDLYNIGQWSQMRRQVLLSLSQPGGHPHNWNLLVENILTLFSGFIQLLKPAETTERPIQSQTSSNIISSDWQSPYRYRNLRNMSLMYDSGMVDVVDVTQSSLPAFDLPKSIVEIFKQKFANAISIMKVILGIKFLFGELPQANIQKCLSNGQIIIWATQGISDIVCASIAEDRYGIVQKDLPIIITTLVQLKQNLDNLNKISILTRKAAGNGDFNYKMKCAITAAVRRSLFKICRTFGKYMSDFPLNKDTVTYLQTIYKN